MSDSDDEAGVEFQRGLSALLDFCEAARNIDEQREQEEKKKVEEPTHSSENE